MRVKRCVGQTADGRVARVSVTEFIHGLGRENMCLAESTALLAAEKNTPAGSGAGNVDACLLGNIAEGVTPGEPVVRAPLMVNLDVELVMVVSSYWAPAKLERTRIRRGKLSWPGRSRWPRRCT